MTFSRRSAGSRRSTARPSRSAANVGAGRSAKHVPQQAVEQLEPRVVLSLAGSAPAPAIGQLEDPGNAIIRLATNFGDIDIELFSDTAPNTVNNIMRLTRAGRYDQSFFHRLVDGFVLQGGGFGFLDATGFNEVQDFGTVDNEFVRSNLERTLSIAKLGGDPDSGSSQFFINLQDNSANLDNQNGGFTVFARVLDDRSWGVVQNITSNVVTDDFTSVDPPLSSAFNETPVRAGTAGNPASEDNLVYIVSARVVALAPPRKPSGYARRCSYRPSAPRPLMTSASTM
ncbi:MAG: peptidylprolyl isomerase [Planctomycetota bacterium]